MPYLNVEIKAHCQHPEQVRQRLLDRKANFIGEDHQIDTYFQTPHGRLKLREGNIENALIHYVRSNQAGPKRSEVLLYLSEPGSSLKAILETALGVLVVIDKRRSIYFIDNVKFHVDEVAGLGSFVEIEAIDQHADIGEKKLLEQCHHYMSYLDIKDEDLVEVSYSDLIMAKNQ